MSYMKILEIITDKLLETDIFEMAMKRKDAKHEVVNLTYQIFRHIVKIYIINLPNYRQHWIDEIDVWLDKIAAIELKPNSSPIDSSTLLKWMTEDGIHGIDAKNVNKVIASLKRNEYKTAEFNGVDPAGIAESINDVLRLVCNDIENETFVTIGKYL